jgi:hypothetical protein
MAFMAQRPQQGRTLTDRDVEAIVLAVESRKSSHCRYDADPKDLEDAITFFRTFSEAVSDSKRTVRRWFLVALMTAMTALIGAGILSKLKGS